MVSVLYKKYANDSHLCYTLAVKKQVIIVGAGAAGVGMGVVLRKIGVDFVILEREEIGQSFHSWSQEMRFITPSFASNFFGSPDLNAITPDSSPAYTIGTEHPSGREYASYLETVVTHYHLPVQTQCEVVGIEKQGEIFSLETNQGHYQSEVVIWAAGEYQFPHREPFSGAQHCLHNSQVKSWDDMEGDGYVVIGGYESGLDCAYHLACADKQVTVIDAGNQLHHMETDASYSVSPYTRDRYREQQERIRVMTDTRVCKVEQGTDGYVVYTDDGQNIVSTNQPILATGFIGGLGLVETMFEYHDGHVLLSECDESTVTSGLFLIGPQVRHGNLIFCFIYKFRQRFAVVGETIAGRIGLSTQAQAVTEEYRAMNMYLSDLSCCGNECVC